MKTPFYLSIAASLLLVGCGGDSDKASATTNTTSSGSTPASAPADYIGALGKAKQTAEKTVDSARVNEAIQMFNAEKGRNPKDLNELVAEKYLPGIPPAPYGMKMVYDPASGKVSIVKQ
jgi:hypothetical protein